MEEQVKSLLTQVTGLPASAITKETHLVRDLGLDSLDVVDLIMQLEQTFNIRIPDEDYSVLGTFQDIVYYVQMATASHELPVA